MNLASGFVGLCALAVPAWWLALYRAPSVRQLFVPPEAWPEFQAVLVPDILLALVSGILAVQLWRDRPSYALLGATCGAWGYATAYSITWGLSVDAPMLGPGLMVGALTGFAAVCYVLVSTRRASAA